MKRKKSNLLNFFSIQYPVCSVCVTISPLYVVLLISFSLILSFDNSFLQVFEKKENKDWNQSISKPKLFKVIPHPSRICSHFRETQIQRTKLPWKKKFKLIFLSINVPEARSRLPNPKFWVVGQKATSGPASFFREYRFGQESIGREPPQPDK